MSSEYDNLPIENRGGGHTISARLEVLDSSINDTTNSDDKCITQKLTLSNRVGGDGNVYIRTGRGRTYDSITWEKWGTLQTNINVGKVGSLDEFVDNGIYSGVWTDGSSFAQTFVMVVINDYAVAGDNKTIVQYKYAYDTLKGNGEPTYNTRSLHNGEWSKWEDTHDDDLSVLKEELLSRIQGRNKNSDAAKDPFKFLGTFTSVTGGEFLNALNAMHGTVSGVYDGFWRALIGAAPVEIYNFPKYYRDDHWIQVLKSPYRWGDGDFTILGDDIRYRTIYRIHENGAWGEWRDTEEELKKSISDETTRAKGAEKNLDDKITAEIQRAKVAEQANTDAINAEIQRAKQAEQANRQLIADLVGESPETLDTIHEISSWILNDETGAAAMAKEINENRNNININKDNIANNSTAIEEEVLRAKDAEKTLQKNIDNTNNIVGIEEKRKLYVDRGAVQEDGSIASTYYSAFTEVFEGGDIAITNDGYYIADARKVSTDGVAEKVAVNSKRLLTEKGYTYQLNISKNDNTQFLEDKLEGIVRLYNYEGGDGTIVKEINENRNAIAREVKRATEAEKDIADNLDALALDVTEFQRDIPYIKNQAARFDGNAFLATANEVNLTTTGVNTSKQWTVSLPTVTTEKAGVMSAKDKKALDTATSRALRALFVAAGAEYNDTDQIIQKTAPWETEEKWRLEDDGTYTYWEEPAIVEHLPGHYYLNGIGDITEGQMIDIFNLPHRGFFPHAYSGIVYKTMICEGNGVYGAISADVLNAWMINSKAEVVSSDKELFCEYGTMNSSFSRCSNLKYIIFPKFYCQYVAFNNAFTRCYSLIRVNLERLSNNISFADSVNVEKKCILYIISKSTTSSAITITLHPDAYARIASQPDIIEALEAKPLITLVSA
jgi:hypothetical protein